MTRCTTGIHTRTYRTLIVATTGGCLLIGFLLAAGCTQNQQEAVASQVLGTPASQLAATTVISTVAGQNPKPKTSSGIKFDGRGGYDSSEAQRNALARAHWFRDHHNEVYRPSWPKPVSTTKPATTQPAATPASAKIPGGTGTMGLVPNGRVTP